MKHIPLLAIALACSAPAAATEVLFTDSTSFHAAAPGATLIEDFEDSLPAQRDILLPSYTGPGNEITFTGLDGTPTPNVFLASAGYTNFGLGQNPTTSVILTANGNENIIGALLSSTVYALGFDVFLNDSPLTISFFNGATLIGALTFDNPPVPGDNLAFAGITSTTGITSFQMVAINGENINTGVDNIYTQTTPLETSVPEPSTWAMMLLGLGAVGVALRRRRKGLAQAA